MPELSHQELRRQVNFFLQDFKELLNEGQYYVMNHFKTTEALLQLGITNWQRDECILSLSLLDYCAGPEQDKLHPGHYWVFGKQINNVEIYIKLKIVTKESGNEKAVCISFHPAEFPLSYPLQ